MTEPAGDRGIAPAPINDHQIQDACDLLYTNPLNRPILYRMLKRCEAAPVRLHELESWIEQRPEFERATQPPYYLIMWLVDARALEEFELDEAGNTVQPEQKQGLSEDEIDDLVADYSYQTSIIGQAVLAEFDPTIRVQVLLEEVPQRRETYLELLEFLRETRSYNDIDELLRGREILMLGRAEGDRPIQPSVFVDKLAAVGGIVWNKGWIISEEGKELLDTIQARK
ncbi:MAG: hypothetical protein LBR39_06170 [Coriobacteriales bacterium]|jgi:hypothetical protein|nr:hypothetical protein [Coriobacteriales bacterium]